MTSRCDLHTSKLLHSANCFSKTLLKNAYVSVQLLGVEKSVYRNQVTYFTFMRSGLCAALLIPKKFDHFGSMVFSRNHFLNRYDVFARDLQQHELEEVCVFLWKSKRSPHKCNVSVFLSNFYNIFFSKLNPNL